MMRVALCQHYYYEYIGVMMIAAHLKKEGHEVEVFIYDLSELVDAAREGRFDLVCFTMMSPDVDWVVESSRKIKAANPSVPIAVGGPHTTFFPEFVAEHHDVDVVCVGEGDQAIVELARAVAEGRSFEGLNNLAFRNSEGGVTRNPLSPLIEDLDSLPFCDRSIYLKYPYFQSPSTTSMVASRGCPYRCNFCFNHRYNQLYNNTRFRLRSPESIIAEVKQIQRSGVPISNLIFVDSTINLDLSWCEDFFKKYGQELDVPFSINLSAGQVNRRMVEALAATGCCSSVRFAVEVGNERIRKEVLRKPLSNAQIIAASELLREHRIPVYVYLMFGVPHETEETARETVEFVGRIRPDFVKSAIFVPFRELDITKNAIEEGFITPEDLDRLDDPSFGSMDSIMNLPDIEQIKNLFYFSPLLIRFPWLLRALNPFLKGKTLKLYRMVYFLSFTVFFRRLLGMSWARTMNEIRHHKIES
jgi:radical SAM superfamily enzyme YgiQ (UPF0313 family)